MCQVNYNNFTESIKSLRKRMKLQQVEFANILGISQSQYSKYEKGAGEFSVKQFLTICYFFDIHPARFFLEWQREPKKLQLHESDE